MFVQDVMTREPATVGVDTPIKRAATVLADRQISSLPVVDTDGRVCGVVSEADLLRDAFTPDTRTHLIPGGEGDRAVARTVSEVMTTHAVSVHMSTDIAQAADLMTSTSIKSLPVIDDDGLLVGVVSRSDLIRLRARSDELIERDVDSMLVSLGHSDWLVSVDDGSVRIEGPESELDRRIAEVAANAVAGVVTVEVH